MAFETIARLIASAAHTLDVERAVATPDELGGREMSWATLAEGLVAWVQPASAAALEMSGKLSQEITHTVYFAADPGLLLGDRLIFSGRKFVVAAVENAGEMGALWQAHCREVKA